jgi:hypothetical protein
MKGFARRRRSNAGANVVCVSGMVVVEGVESDRYQYYLIAPYSEFK